MMNLSRIDLTWDDVRGLVERKLFPKAKAISGCKSKHLVIQKKIYGIPRGGIHVALLLHSLDPMGFRIVEREDDADIFVDDIIDSGATKKLFKSKYPSIPFIALVDKKTPKDPWYSFPWERMSLEMGPEQNITRILEYVGENPGREGLAETPNRVVRSWEKLYGGYKSDPKAILKTFNEDSSDEMVILKNIEFYSTCEHHLLPFFGKAHIAYIPKGKVVGISKLARLLEVYARRMQIQERICKQITEALDENLHPLGSACILEAQHFCMTSRGVEKQNSVMVTSSLTGVFKEKPEARAEFMSIVRQ